MQKKISTICLMVIMAGLLLAGCQKYEEGPAISFHTPLYRLYGSYGVMSYSVNSVDCLSLYYDSLSLNVKIYYNEHDASNSVA